MSILITDDCINCSACEAECPKSAVYPNIKNTEPESLFINNKFLLDGFVSFEHYYVNPVLCNDCQGIYPAPRCKEVCPVSCCLSVEEYYHQDKSSVKVKTNPVTITKISLN
ncbi:MAG: 4Fe-4S dicluster domain-containing protein [Ignavibacteria bacterium]|nr:4Fe-4S dicluster domain-containing protein [Ignavibacteria bacterium]